MDTLRSIVVGIDFTPGAAAALRQATRLARAEAGAASLRAVHVIDTLVVIDLQHALSPLQKNVQSTLEAEARREWARFEPGLAGKDKIELAVRVGNPTTSLLDEADAAKADLLIVGMHKEEGSDEGVGSVASALVRKATSRVLMVRAEQNGPFKRVVACVDFSETSLRVVEEAIRVAKMDGAILDIVHVFEPPWKQLHYFAPMPENSPEFQAGYRAFITSKLREFCKPLEGEMAGLTCEFKLDEQHSSGRGIIDFAKRIKADLIVMGTHGRSNLREIILGSTAERVLRKCPCSMLTVRPAE